MNAGDDDRLLIALLLLLEVVFALVRVLVSEGDAMEATVGTAELEVDLRVAGTLRLMFSSAA